MARKADRKLREIGEGAVSDKRPLRRPSRDGRSFYPLAGMILFRSALFVVMAVSCSAGCAAPQRVAVADSDPRDPAPQHRSTAATKALDVQTAQMAEEDQRRAAEAYERVPLRNRRFRDEPIRSRPRP